MLSTTIIISSHRPASIPCEERRWHFWSSSPLRKKLDIKLYDISIPTVLVYNRTLTPKHLMLSNIRSMKWNYFVVLFYGNLIIIIILTLVSPRGIPPHLGFSPCIFFWWFQSQKSLLLAVTRDGRHLGICGNHLDLVTLHVNVKCPRQWSKYLVFLP